MSPVIVVDKEKRPILHPGTKDKKGNLISQKDGININKEDFLKELRVSLDPYIKDAQFDFIPVGLKKEVIKHSIGEHLRKGLKRPIKLIGFSGRFILKGRPEDLYKIYQLGIGFRRNQGFGMLEVE